MRYHSQMLRQVMPMRVERSRERWGWLRDARSQRHMRTPGIVILHPCCQKMTEMVYGQWNHQGHTFLPQRADEPLTESMGLGTLRWRFEDAQAHVTDMLVKLRGENTIPVV